METNENGSDEGARDSTRRLGKVETNEGAGRGGRSIGAMKIITRGGGDEVDKGGGRGKEDEGREGKGEGSERETEDHGSKFPDGRLSAETGRKN